LSEKIETFLKRDVKMWIDKAKFTKFNKKEQAVKRYQLVLALLRVGSKISQVIPISVKKSRCCHILYVKCPVILGLL
jgi:hypothetical protein